MVKKANYELKAQVIGNGCAKVQRKVSLSSWKETQLKDRIYNLEIAEEILGEDKTEELEESYQKLDKILELKESQLILLESYSQEEIQEAIKVNDAGYKRTKRLKDRISKYLENQNAIFVTLTFRDSVLQNTNEQSRRDYVRKYLKSQCLYYVANIDFGKTNEREHYHAVVVPKLDKGLDSHPYIEQCGSIDFERVWHRQEEEDFENTAKRIAKYVNKLTNHAVKETTRQCRIIYSRE